ncbi:hypothetical protein OAM21_02100 [Verrucomicrobia bacterium]|nr:hypothetical protein [Verrucomicrobiota bacterium]
MAYDMFFGKFSPAYSITELGENKVNSFFLPTIKGLLGIPNILDAFLKVTLITWSGMMNMV